MDTTDPNIRFDSSGVCDYCTNFERQIRPNWRTGEEGDQYLAQLATEIRRAGKGQRYDCIIGISGGLDSSYTALVATRKMGLRPLLFHVDAGWNTEQAVSNIERLVDGLNLDLYTEVIDWEEMKDLQRAFLYSQIVDQDLPQDAAFFSALFRYARTNGIKYVLTGGNYSTECCREPDAWGSYPGADVLLFNDIHSRFGAKPLSTFPLLDILQYKLLYQQILGMKVRKPLDHVRFVKVEAEKELEALFGWRPFQHKHHESRFTRFYEDFWMPRKFGFDRRRAHFSSLIQTGQMKRAEAVERLKAPEMSETFLRHEFEFVAKKLDFSVGELEAIFAGPNKTYMDYRNKRWVIGLGATVLQTIGLERRLYR